MLFRSALGHLHRYQNLNKSGTPVVYAGSIERVDFGERKESKGFCSVTIEKCGDDKRQTAYSFVELPTRPMIQIEVFLDGVKDQTEQIIDAIKKHDINDAIVKIMYHIPEGKQDRVDLAVVLQVCAQAMYVVGILPIHKLVTRERRAALKVDMDYTTLLSRYIESKETLHARKALLIEKAITLQQELELQKLESEQG